MQSYSVWDHGVSLVLSPAGEKAFASLNRDPYTHPGAVLLQHNGALIVRTNLYKSDVSTKVTITTQWRERTMRVRQTSI